MMWRRSLLMGFPAKWATTPSLLLARGPANSDRRGWMQAADQLAAVERR